MTKEEAIKMFLDDGTAELSVKAEQGGRVTTELRGEVHKLGWMVAKAANGIFSEIEDARIVEALDLAITKTIHEMAAHRIAQIKKTDTPFDLTVEMSAVPFNVNDIIKTILRK